MVRNRAVKGYGFEREICKALSYWWTDDERDDVFWRSQASGGRATIRKKKDKATEGQYGDIAATDPIGQPFIQALTLEAKRGYNDHIISPILDVPDGKEHPEPLERFFLQAEAAAQKAKSFSWALIHRRDRRDCVIYLPTSVVVELQMLDGPRVDDLPGPVLSLRWDMLAPDGYVIGQRNVTAMRFDKFLASYKPAMFLTLAECAPCNNA